jgi:hypothetical protein
MSGNFPEGMTERDWAYVNGEGAEDDTIDPSEDDTSPFRGHYREEDD